METEWNKLTVAERAAFAEWQAEQKRPKQTKDMTPEELRAFERKHGLPSQRRAGAAR